MKFSIFYFEKQNFRTFLEKLQTISFYSFEARELWLLLFEAAYPPPLLYKRM